MLYGDYGVGKTTLASTADDVDEMRDLILVNAESGDMALQDKDIDEVTLNMFSQFARVTDYLKAHCQARDFNTPEAIERLCSLESRFKGYEVTNPKRYRTLIVDSLTEIQKLVMYQLLGVKIGQRLDAEPESAEYKQWGQSTEMIRLLVRTLRDLPMNVIFILPSEIKEDDAKRQIRAPMLPGKLSFEVQGFLDMVGYYRLGIKDDKTIRILHLEAGRTYQAKHRFGPNTPPALENPTMKDIYRFVSA